MTRRDDDGPGPCMYAHACLNDATTTVPNPILGPVPCCESCRTFYESH